MLRRRLCIFALNMITLFLGPTLWVSAASAVVNIDSAVDAGTLSPTINEQLLVTTGGTLTFTGSTVLTADSVRVESGG